MIETNDYDPRQERQREAMEEAKRRAMADIAGLSAAPPALPFRAPPAFPAALALSPLSMPARDVPEAPAMGQNPAMYGGGNADYTVATNTVLGAQPSGTTTAGVLVEGTNVQGYTLVCLAEGRLKVARGAEGDDEGKIFVDLMEAPTGTPRILVSDATTGKWSYGELPAGAGIGEAPGDGNKYARIGVEGVYSWITFTEGFADTGVDTKTYGRRDNTWVEIGNKLVESASIGTVTTLAYDASATVELTFLAGALTFNYGIPAGPPGVTEATVGSVSTIDAGGTATANVLLAGTTLTFTFGLVKGADGEDGDTPTEADLLALIEPLIDAEFADTARNPLSVDLLPGDADLSDVIATVNELITALKR